MDKYLISGVKSGLGKFLKKKLEGSTGFGRNEFNLLKQDSFDTIIHCAFNKEIVIADYYRYLADNIFLTQQLLDLDYRRFIYISSIDVYQGEPNIYSMFKNFSESLVTRQKDTTTLRCSMILGPTMKPNHVTKIRDGIELIGLSGESTFNYISMHDIQKFIEVYSNQYKDRMYDFVANRAVKLTQVKRMFNSSTQFGDAHYKSNYRFENPIYKHIEEFDKSSVKVLENLFK